MSCLFFLFVPEIQNDLPIVCDLPSLQLFPSRSSDQPNSQNVTKEVRLKEHALRRETVIFANLVVNAANLRSILNSNRSHTQPHVQMLQLAAGFEFESPVTTSIHHDPRYAQLKYLTRSLNKISQKCRISGVHLLLIRVESDGYIILYSLVSDSKIQQKYLYVGWLGS